MFEFEMNRIIVCLPI